MKKSIIVLLAFVALLFGCSEDTLLNDLAKSADENALQSEMVNANKKEPVTRPFKLRGSGTFAPMNEPCDSGLLQLLVAGSGNATHFGLFNVEITYCTNPPVGSIHILNGTLTAANGDKIFFYSNNLINIGDSGLDDGGLFTIYHITGGTERFNQASGDFKLYGIVDFENGVYSNYGEGEITY